MPSVRREASGVTDATRAWLEAKDVAGTALGAVALVLANRIDEAIVTPVSGTTLAAMSRELRATLRELEKAGAGEPDVLDELKARRKARLGGTRQR